MADFNLAYAPVAKWEGGWTHDSGDKGGETFRGCARNFFPNEPIWPVIDREKSHPSYKKGKAAFSAHLMGIPSLTGCVKGWYKKEWWDKLGLERFDQIVADELFEQAVNLGKAGMGRYLQRLCNAFNWRKDGSADGARLFDDLQTDGVEDAFGPFHRPFPERRPAHRAPHELYAGRALRKQRGEPFPAAEILRGRLADAHL